MLPVAAVVFVAGTLINPAFVSEFNLSAILLDVAIFGFLVLGEPWWC